MTKYLNYMLLIILLTAFIYNIGSLKSETYATSVNYTAIDVATGGYGGGTDTKINEVMGCMVNPGKVIMISAQKDVPPNDDEIAAKCSDKTVVPACANIKNKDGKSLEGWPYFEGTGPSRHVVQIDTGFVGNWSELQIDEFTWSITCQNICCTTVDTSSGKGTKL